MLTKIGAPFNIIIGVVALLGEFWMNAAISAIPGVEPAFGWVGTFLYSLFFLSCPICLIWGSSRALKFLASWSAVFLYSYGCTVLVWFLAPAIHEGFHPEPLVYIDLPFTYSLLVLVVLALAATSCLLADFIRFQRARKLAAAHGA